VTPDGLPARSGENAYGLPQDAQAAGVQVSTVSIMTMDYHDGQPVLAQAESSAEATASQLATLYGVSVAPGVSPGYRR
jgi:chitinase